jgi:hypothetical protein
MPHAQKRAPTATGRDAGSVAAYQPPQPDPKRWLVLAVIAVCQLMIVLDASIVNIALPQRKEIQCHSKSNPFTSPYLTPT